MGVGNTCGIIQTPPDRVWSPGKIWEGFTKGLLGNISANTSRIKLGESYLGNTSQISIIWDSNTSTCTFTYLLYTKMQGMNLYLTVLHKRFAVIYFSTTNGCLRTHIWNMYWMKRSFAPSTHTEERWVKHQ